MTRASLLLASLLALSSGCTVMAVSASDDQRPRNSCSQETECGTGYSCRTGVCQTLNGELESLLITATPPSDSFLPHLTLVRHLDDVPTDGKTKDIELPAPPQIKGKLKLPQSMSCYPAFQNDDGTPLLSAFDSSIPVTVTLALRQRALGLSQQVYYARTDSPVSGSYAFRVKVPAGEYDVYLAPPRRQNSDTCLAPPQFYRRFPIGLTGEGEDPAVSAEITFRMSAISRLKLVIVWPSSGPSLKGWVADIIEPTGGNSISTQVVLPEPTVVGQMSEYSVPLVQTSVVMGTSTVLDSTGELLRLRPPASSGVPTIYLDRSALGLLQPNPDDEVRLTAFTRLPTAVEVHGQMRRLPEGSSVAGTVTFISTEIYGVDPGIFASYQTSIDVGPDGQIGLELPPGKYRVHGEPLPWSGGVSSDDRLAVAETVWDVPADIPIQLGRVVELEPLRDLGGHARFPGSVVRAVPSLQNTSPFRSVFGDLPLYPRPSSGLVDESGRFTLPVDPGRFDVTVRASEELGYGWYVRPGVEVSDGDVDLNADFRLPSVLTGKATIALPSGAQPLASAAISAYAYLNQDLAYTRDPDEAVAIALVAETRTRNDGAFRLLLPAGIVSGSK
jgi:hypothetical protein